LRWHNCLQENESALGKNVPSQYMIVRNDPNPSGPMDSAGCTSEWINKDAYTCSLIYRRDPETGTRWKAICGGSHPPLLRDASAPRQSRRAQSRLPITSVAGLWILKGLGGRGRTRRWRDPQPNWHSRSGTFDRHEASARSAWDGQAVRRIARFASSIIEMPF
jgi:hypothetical protein